MKIEIKNEIKENVKSFVGAIAKKSKSNPKLLYKYINDKKSVKTHMKTTHKSLGKSKRGHYC